MTDEEALRYADEFHIPMPTSKEVETTNDQEAIAEQLQQGPVEEEEEEEEEEEQPAAKTPKSAKKVTGKRKTATPGAEAEVATPASPDKKRKRPSKVTEEKEPEPKKSGRKKAKSG